MRVRIEFETTAHLTNGRWFANVKGKLTEVKPEWVTILNCPEPTKSGLYKLTWEDNLKDVAYFNGQHWHRTGDATKYTWEDLEMYLVAVERIDL